VSRDLHEADAALVLDRALRQFDTPLSDERLCPEPRAAATRSARVKQAALYQREPRS